MSEFDDIRPRGTVTVRCSHPGCTWKFWVDPLHPALPDGPFLCVEHSGEPVVKHMREEPPHGSPLKRSEFTLGNGDEGRDYKSEFDNVRVLRAAVLRDALVDVKAAIQKLDQLVADGDVVSGNTNHSWLKARMFATDARDRLIKAIGGDGKDKDA